MENTCIFCKICHNQAPAKVEYKDDKVTVIHDINPKAPVHLLIIPNEHIESLIAIDEEQHKDILSHILLTAKKIAQLRGLDSKEKGYRLVVNTGKQGGQIVWHLHVHFLAGEQL
ncbi:MAG: histidine triad nucleotide-binding protein [bacterium]